MVHRGAFAKVHRLRLPQIAKAGLEFPGRRSVVAPYASSGCQAARGCEADHAMHVAVFENQGSYLNKKDSQFIETAM